MNRRTFLKLPALSLPVPALPGQKAPCLAPVPNMRGTIDYNRAGRVLRYTTTSDKWLMTT